MSETTVRFVKINNTWGQLLTDDYGVLEALYKRFSVPVENYWFMPAFKAGRWDGKIHFVSQDGRFYNGLFNRILKYFKDDDSFKLIIDQEYKKEFSDIEVLKKDFLDVTNKTLTVIDPYIYQIRGALKAIYQMNSICEHATGSGKSYTICMVANYLLQKNPKHKILILVPKLDLVEQLTENFVTFGIPKEMVGKFCGYQKDEDQAIIVSTWQSVYTKPKFLRKFTVLVCDECHSLKADVIRGVAEKAINCTYRLGFTGTMPEQKSDHLLVEGILGPVVDQVLPDELIRLKTISDIKINIIKLLYPDSRIKMMEDQDYQLEKEFAETDKFRNAIICKLAKGTADKDRNCLVLVKKIDHGETLVKMLEAEGCNVEFISGDTKIKDRNDVRHDVEGKGGQIIVATVGVYSTGVSINRLHTVIFAAAGKSKIQTLQSVGRGLRLHPTKDKLYLYDIAENLNFSEKHLKKRLQYYETNKFNVEVKEVTVKCLD